MKTLFKAILLTFTMAVVSTTIVTQEAKVEASENEVRKAKVTAWALNVRPTPTMSNKPSGYLKKGDVVTVYEVHSSGWVKVGENQYVYKTFIEQISGSLEPTINDSNNTSTNKQEESKPAESQTVQGSSTYGSISLTSGERDLLARLVRAEAGGESFTGQVAVAQVVFNRMKSERFPNTLEGVVYQKKQFSPVMNGSINRSANSSNYEAVDYALNNADVTSGALFFYAPSLVRSPFMETLKHIKVIGVHHFKGY